MAIHDISVPIQPGMHIYRNNPGYSRSLYQAIADGAEANVSELDLGAHTGTHVDGPAHFYDGGAGTEVLDLDAMIGPCLIVEIPDRGLEPIDAAALEATRAPAGTERLLLKTTNSQLWDRGEFTHDFIRLDKSGAEWVLERGIRLIGIDYLSIGDGDAHRALLGEADRRARGPRPARDRARPLRADLPADAPRRRLRRRPLAGRASRPRRLGRGPAAPLSPFGLDMDGSEALDELAETERLLQAYADERGLQLRPEYPWPGALPPAEQPGPVKHAMWSLAGRFPGGATGRLRHQATFGKVHGDELDVGLQHTIMVCRMPESVGYVPMLCCRPKELMSGMYYWGGDQRKRQSQVFESVELDRRYEVELAPGQSQQWLCQLFTPKFIDWLAHETPQDFGFKLDLGVFTCELPEWRGQEGSTERQVRPDYLDRLAAVGGTVAGRIRDEILEEAGTRGISEVDSAAAYADWANAKKHGKIVGSILVRRQAARRRRRRRQVDQEVGRRSRHRDRVARRASTPAGSAWRCRRSRRFGPRRARHHRPRGLGRLARVREPGRHAPRVHRRGHAGCPARARCPSAGSMPTTSASPPSARASPPEALEHALGLGYGLSTSKDGICVYMRTRAPRRAPRSTS